LPARVDRCRLNITERRHLEELRQRATAQVEVQRRLMEHREQERNLIARDLHDGPLQELISTNFALSDLIDMPDETQRAERLRQIMGQIQNQIKELRTFCYDLRPPALAPFGLQKAILSHMETFKQRNAGIIFRWI
jgi:two-component system sensor histidine kinase ComP